MVSFGRGSVNRVGSDRVEGVKPASSYSGRCAPHWCQDRRSRSPGSRRTRDPPYCLRVVSSEPIHPVGRGWRSRGLVLDIIRNGGSGDCGLNGLAWSSPGSSPRTRAILCECCQKTPECRHPLGIPPVRMQHGARTPSDTKAQGRYCRPKLPNPSQLRALFPTNQHEVRALFALIALAIGSIRVRMIQSIDRKPTLIHNNTALAM